MTTQTCNSSSSKTFQSCVKHPYGMAAITFAAILTTAEFLADGNFTPLTWAVEILRVILLVTSYWFPTTSSVTLISISLICALSPREAFTLQMWADWLSFAILGNQRHHITATALLLSHLVGRLIAVSLYPNSLWAASGVITLVGTYAMLYAFGFAWAEHKDAEKAREKERESAELLKEQKRLRHNLDLASRIHDSTAQGLTLISLLADQCAFNLEHDIDCAETNKRIGELARKTLSEVRGVIDALSAAEESPSLNEESRNLSQFLTAQDDQMAALGYIGLSSVSNDAQTCVQHLPAQLQDELYNLLGQLYANILSHGCKGEESYYLSLSMENGTLILREFNIVPSSPRISNHLCHGLRLHTQRLQSFGASLSTKFEDDLWSVVVTIPESAQCV